MSKKETTTATMNDLLLSKTVRGALEDDYRDVKRRISALHWRREGEDEDAQFASRVEQEFPELVVSCPKCEAIEGEFCVTPDGDDYRGHYAHAARKEKTEAHLLKQRLKALGMVSEI